MYAEDFEAPDGLNVAERIRRLASERATLDVAQFQFIGLTDIRARYGEGWPAKRDQVQAIARLFIARRINTEDVMIPGADGFLVVFGRRTGLLADAAAQRIAKALNDFFIGSHPDDIGFRFHARRRTMSIEDITAAFAELTAVESMAGAYDISPQPPREPTETRIAFQPAWDARREALTTAVVRPIDTHTDRPAAGYHFDARPDTPRYYADIDEHQLRASEDAIRTLFASGRRTLLTTSLHLSSLQNAAALTRLLAAMGGFDRKAARYRVIRVAGIEPGFPRIYLEDICRVLRTRVPNIVFGLDWREPDLASALRLQPAGAGFLLPSDGGVSSLRPETLARIRGAAETCRQHRLPFFVDGDFGPDTAQRLVADGVDILASPRLWPMTDALDGAEKWPAARLGSTRDSAA